MLYVYLNFSILAVNKEIVAYNPYAHMSSAEGNGLKRALLLSSASSALGSKAMACFLLVVYC